MTDVERFKTIVAGMTDLYQKKNANYGNSFEKLFDELGPISGLVPLHNKLDRATNLVKGGHNDFESLEDTMIDLANYAIMNVIELQKIAEKETSKITPVENIEVKPKPAKEQKPKEKVVKAPKVKAEKKIQKKDVVFTGDPVAEQARSYYSTAEEPEAELIVNSEPTATTQDIESQLKQVLANASKSEEPKINLETRKVITTNTQEREGVYKW